MTGSASVLHACTIVSKNYLSYARVLARSVLDHHRQRCLAHER